MTLHIQLNSESESRLKSAASRRGLEPEAYAKQILEQNLPTSDTVAKDQATLDLLAKWDAEDETSDTAEIEARGRELEEFKQAINRNRLESEGPDSRKIFP